MAALGVGIEPMSFDTKNLSIGSVPDEALDLVCSLFDGVAVAADDGNTDSAALPAVLMVDLGNAHCEATTQAFGDGLECSPLLLERLARGEAKIYVYYESKHVLAGR